MEEKTSEKTVGSLVSSATTMLNTVSTAAATVATSIVVATAATATTATANSEEPAISTTTTTTNNNNNNTAVEIYKDSNYSDEYDEISTDNSGSSSSKVPSRAGTPKGNFVCEVCGKECPTRAKLLDHRVSHFDAKPFKCTYEGCDSAFKRQRQLDSHIKICHLGVRPYKCMEAGCTAAFFTTSALKTHMKMHARELACPYEGCGATFHKKTQLRAHMSAEHTGDPGKPYSCSTCGMSFAYPSQLERHEAKHATIDHLCAYDDCGFVAPTFKELRDHINTCHLGVQGENMRCPECGKEVTRAWYHQHMKTHSTKTLQSFPCTVPGCSKVYASKKSLRAHFNASHSDHKFVCPVCAAEFAYKVSMVKHVKRVHPDFDASSLSPQPSASPQPGVKRKSPLARASSSDAIITEVRDVDSPHEKDETGKESTCGGSNGGGGDSEPNGANPIACKIAGVSRRRALAISH